MEKRCEVGAVQVSGDFDLFAGYLREIQLQPAVSSDSQGMGGILIGDGVQLPSSTAVEGDCEEDSGNLDTLPMPLDVASVAPKVMMKTAVSARITIDLPSIASAKMPEIVPFEMASFYLRIKHM